MPIYPDHGHPGRMARTHTVRRVITTTAIICGAGWLAAACASPSAPSAGATPNNGSPVQSATTAPATSPAAPSTPTSSAAGTPATYAVTGTVTDNQGNRMQLSLTIGQPEPLSSTTDSVAQSCDSDIEGQNMTLNQVVVYPVDFSETLLSSVATNVDLAISEYFVNSAGNENFNAGVNSLDPGYSFAGIVGGQDYCGDGQIDWQDQTPETTETWDAYLIVPDAITPDDPTGLNQTAGPILISPALSVDSVFDNNYDIDTADSTNLVTCDVTNADGSETSGTYIAMDPTYAVASGCKE